MRDGSVLKTAGSMKYRSMWGVTLFLSLAFNWALFSIMPHLISGKPDGEIILQRAHTIDVIRVKKPEKSVKRKPPAKRKPDEKIAEKNIQKKLFARQKPMRLKLPFDLNTKLPDGPGMVPTLFLEKYDIKGVEAYEIDDIDQPLTAIVRIPPIYPMRARRLGVEGHVTVKMLVTEKGFVEKTQILAAQPEGVFEKSVLQCTSSWRFTPGTIDGVPVKTFVTTTIRFNLENE